MRKPRLGQVQVRKVRNQKLWDVQLFIGGRWCTLWCDEDQGEAEWIAACLQDPIDAIIAEATA